MGIVRKRLEKIRQKPEVRNVLMEIEGNLKVAKVVVKAPHVRTTKEELEDVALEAVMEHYPDVKWWELREMGSFLNRGGHFMVTYREAPIRVVR